jgi:hypothetical protein
VEGSVGHDVTGIAVHDKGRTFRAIVDHGRWTAWWPGGVGEIDADPAGRRNPHGDRHVPGSLTLRAIRSRAQGKAQEQGRSNALSKRGQGQRVRQSIAGHTAQGGPASIIRDRSVELRQRPDVRLLLGRLGCSSDPFWGVDRWRSGHERRSGTGATLERPVSQ